MKLELRQVAVVGWKTLELLCCLLAKWEDMVLQRYQRNEAKKKSCAVTIYLQREELCAKRARA